MADDERRAEIEAVAEALWDDTTARWSEPVAFAEANDKSRESYLNDARIAVAALDRVRDARDDDRPLARRCGHVKPDVNCPACAADAFDALARVRDAEAELERLRAINAELVEAHNTLLVDAARSPQDEDHDG